MVNAPGPWHLVAGCSWNTTTHRGGGAIDGAVMRGLTDLFGLHKGAGREKRARLRLNADQTAVYAVGDVHGCLDALLDLERTIVADGESLSGDKAIVMLGGYVARGPALSQVIAHLLGPPPAGFERICLAGNHEVLMLDYLDG